MRSCAHVAGLALKRTIKLAIKCFRQSLVLRVRRRAHGMGCSGDEFPAFVFRPGEVVAMAIVFAVLEGADVPSIRCRATQDLLGCLTQMIRMGIPLSRAPRYHADMQIDLGSFRKVLAALERCVARAEVAPLDEEPRDSVIQRFEFT